MAALGIRMAARVNGVSRLHGEVARAMFAPLFPGVAVDDVPIGHVTNGVHAETWVGPEFAALYRARLGDGYGARSEGWERLAEISDEELFAARARARERSSTRCAAAWRSRLPNAATTHPSSPGRPRCSTRRPSRSASRGESPPTSASRCCCASASALVRILHSDDRPVQLLVAGKAHPHDGDGKRLIEEFGAFAASHDVRHRVIMLADYDMALARVLVSGVDVWLNTPLRPLEACGTSGMKAALNGVLNLSILDGWWDECYDPPTAGPSRPPTGQGSMRARAMRARRARSST